ncbi:MAG: hypothetical protein LBM99_01620 [Bacillales bacterium]|jgi:DNA-binding transcriptional MerR regulator|nr:hypothetical protein [Bacillales bacterium]
MDRKKLKQITTLNDDNLNMYEFFKIIKPKIINKKKEYSDEEGMFLIKLTILRKLGFSINEIENELLNHKTNLIEKLAIIIKMLEGNTDEKSMVIRKIIRKIVDNDLTVDTLPYSEFLMDMKYYHKFGSVPVLWTVEDYFPEISYALNFKKIVTIFGIIAFSLLFILIIAFKIFDSILWLTLALASYTFFCWGAIFILRKLSLRRLKK